MAAVTTDDIELACDLGIWAAYLHKMTMEVMEERLREREKWPYIWQYDGTPLRQDMSLARMHANRVVGDGEERELRTAQLAESSQVHEMKIRQLQWEIREMMREEKRGENVEPEGEIGVEERRAKRKGKKRGGKGRKEER